MYENIYSDRERQMREESLSLSSKLENLHEAERFVENVLDKNHIDDKFLASVTIAVSEAVKNAIAHGNQNDADKKVNILFDYCKVGEIAFTITDEGEGFDFANAISFLEKDENLQQQGLFLIKHLADDMTFQKNGSEIIMEFMINTSGINPVRTQERVNLLLMYSEGIYRIKHA